MARSWNDVFACGSTGAAPLAALTAPLSDLEDQR